MQPWKLGTIGLVLAVGSAAVLQSPMIVNAQSRELNCKQPMTQTAMNICSARAAHRSDKALNQAYQQVRQEYRNRYEQKSRLTKRLSQLTDAQLAWIKYRDTNCKWQADRYEGGSIRPLIYYSCLGTMTDQRTQELLNSLKP